MNRPFKEYLTDLRTIVALLFTAYGVLVILTYLFGKEHAEVNLYTGLGLLLAAILFYTWSWFKPLSAPDKK